MNPFANAPLLEVSHYHATRESRVLRKAKNRRRYIRMYSRRAPAPTAPRSTKPATIIAPIGYRLPLAYLRAVWGVAGETNWDRKQAAKKVAA